MPYQQHLSRDRVLKTLIRNQGPQLLELKPNIMWQICMAIIGQQLSIKVAATLRLRFVTLLNNKKPTAKNILAIPHEALRKIGLSNAKAQYVKNVCQFFLDHHLTDQKLLKLTDAEFIDQITEIKGVGRWTAEMLLMFSMAREDVFSMGDLGLQKAICLQYKLTTTTKKELTNHMERIVEKWKPFRTYACLHLWRSLDGPMP